MEDTIKTGESADQGPDRVENRSVRQKLADWAKSHRTELATAGATGAVAAFVAFIVFVKPRSAARKSLLPPKPPGQMATKDAVCMLMPGAIAARSSHDVRAHIRNLPAGWSASAEKVAEAAARGIELEQGQTLVAAYRTGAHAA